MEALEEDLPGNFDRVSVSTISQDKQLVVIPLIIEVLYWRKDTYVSLAAFLNQDTASFIYENEVLNINRQQVAINCCVLYFHVHVF